MTWQWILMLIPVALIAFMIWDAKSMEKEARDGSFRGIKFEDLRLPTDGGESVPCSKVILNGETIWERGKTPNSYPAPDQSTDPVGESS